MTKRGCFSILPSKSACLAEEAIRVHDTETSFEYTLACLDLNDFGRVIALSGVKKGKGKGLFVYLT
jgi:hypothetical protein